MKSTLILSIMAGVMLGCKTNTKNTAQKQPECVPVQHPDLLDGKTKARVTVLSVIVENDRLNAELEYESHRKKEEPYMVWNGMLMKSLPPKASVEIGVYHAEPCENCDVALVKGTFCFDISKLREKTRAQGLVILVEGFDKPINIPAEK